MGRRALASLSVTVSALALAACSGMAGVPREMRSWNRSFPPYRIIGNIYYVGSNAIAQYLITTPQGHILLDSGSRPRCRAWRTMCARSGSGSKT